MRRLRSTQSLRKLACETRLTEDDLILPVFVVEGSGRSEPIEAMPGVFRYSEDLLVKHCEKIRCPAIMLFGVPGQRFKDKTGSYALDENGIVPKAVSAVKKARPDLAVITDLCLCAYTDHGHCGVLSEKGRIENDKSVELLGRMATVHAASGADMTAPSAMMDRQVEAVRSALDRAGFGQTGIISYAAKFASAFYGPFREAAASQPTSGDRSGYQLPPGNSREAIRDALLDRDEGADWLMVKPAMPYLDILHELSALARLPVAAYQVSGEYSMIKSASAAGMLSEEQAFMESLTAMKRAGASAIISYWADEACRVMGES